MEIRFPESKSSEEFIQVRGEKLERVQEKFSFPGSDVNKKKINKNKKKKKKRKKYKLLLENKKMNSELGHEKDLFSNKESIITPKVVSQVNLFCKGKGLEEKMEVKFSEKKPDMFSISQSLKDFKREIDSEFEKISLFSSKALLKYTLRYREASDIYFKFNDRYDDDRSSKRYIHTNRWSIPSVLEGSLRDLFKNFKGLNISWGDELYKISYDGSSDDIFQTEASFQGKLVNPPFINFEIHYLYFAAKCKESDWISFMIAPCREGEAWFKHAEKNFFIIFLKNNLAFRAYGIEKKNVAPEKTIIICFGLKRGSYLIENNADGVFYLDHLILEKFNHSLLEKKGIERDGKIK
ncbi:MAG: hypothetical protein HRT87_10765 [Legionellales bacterium]|nr:hypothetical protein [Legionellales bacterium]